VAEVRHVLTKNLGSLGTTGSVAWQFDRIGQIYVDAARHDEDATLEAALEAGASDMQREGDEYLISTDLTAFNSVQEALRRRGIQFTQAELAMVPRSMVDVAGDEAGRIVRLLDALDDLDDVQKVYSNANVDESAFAESGA
jgi:transcriptional/translational regulatory protein YebC/TACO1